MFHALMMLVSISGQHMLPESVVLATRWFQMGVQCAKVNRSNLSSTPESGQLMLPRAAIGWFN